MSQLSKFAGTPFMCDDPPAGFGIRFNVAEDHSIYVDVTFDSSKQGGRGILHGGAIAAVLDEAMGVAAYEAGKPGYTATMTYNYHSHIPLHQPVKIRAWIKEVNGRKVFAECDVRLADGTVAVTGSGLFIESQKLREQLDQHPYQPLENEE